MWRDDAVAPDGPWGWLLRALGYTVTDTWDSGCSWRLGDSHIVLGSGPDHLRGKADRRRSGLNHVAFWAGSRADVDALTAEAAERGWRLLFADEHPYASGRHHYAAYLEDDAGFEIEIVADE